MYCFMGIVQWKTLFLIFFVLFFSLPKWYVRDIDFAKKIVCVTVVGSFIFNCVKNNIF